jgi:alkylation response protein AidB-like acyl-CoA dehydrogenase
MNARGDDQVAGYLQALRRLAPLIAEHRGDFDRNRQVPEAVFNALADAGLFRLWLPEALGGPELSPVQFMRVVEAASALDGSVGWLVGNGGGMSRIGGYLPAAVAQAWFSTPRTFVASSTGAAGTAAKVDGGYRVSGRWPFASGAPHATHFMGLADVMTEKGPGKPRLCCYVPRDAVVLRDTWHVSGLRATGSCDFDMDNVFVPAEHAHPLIDSTPTQPGLLYRMPPLSVFAWTVSVVPLGIARGAMNTFAELAGRKTRLSTSAPLCEREIVQASVGRSETLSRAARALLAEAMTEVMQATEAGGDRLMHARAQLRAACAHAAETALRIVDMLAAEAGSVAIFESCALERAVRDVQAAVKHVAMNPSSYVITGRLALGLDPGNARF